MHGWCHDTTTVGSAPPQGDLQLPLVVCGDLKWYNSFYIEQLVSRYKSYPPFILVTTDDDRMPIQSNGRHRNGRLRPQGASRDGAPFESSLQFLNQKNLVGWYSTNQMVSHPKLHSLPIGLPWPPGGLQKLKMVLDKCQTLAAAPRTHKRSHLLLINFGLHGAEVAERRDILDNVHRWAAFARIHISDGSPLSNDYGNYLAELADASFIFSPPGFGWDCYRTWEALYVGAIPVLLKTGTQFDGMFADLPVLFVDSYMDVTEAMLLATLSRLKTAQFNWAKLTVTFWQAKIRRTANKWAREHQ